MRILYRVQQVPAKSLEWSIPGCPCQRQNVPSPLLCPLQAPNNLRRLRLLALKGDRRLVRPSVLWRGFFCASCHDLDIRHVSLQSTLWARFLLQRHPAPESTWIKHTAKLLREHTIIPNSVRPFPNTTVPSMRNAREKNSPLTCNLRMYVYTP
jgi:hypothetical protein